MRVFGVFLSLNGLLFILCEREKFYYFLDMVSIKTPLSYFSEDILTYSLTENLLEIKKITSGGLFFRQSLVK